MQFDEKETFSVRFALSIFNSKALENAIKLISDYYWHLPIDELARWANPSESDRRLRRRYWRIVSAAVANGAKYTLGDLHNGICTYTHLYNNVLSNPYKLSWILKPSIETKTEVEDLQDKLFDSLREILELNNYRRDGSVNHANLKLKIKVANVILNLK